MSYTVRDHKGLYRTALSKVQDIFELGTPITQIDSTPPFNNEVGIYIPNQDTGIKGSAGFKLKGGGIISGRETLDVSKVREVKLFSYSYRLLLPTYNYTIDCNGRSEHPLEIRFEKDPTKNTPDHPLYHIHVMHDAPRYPSIDGYDFTIFLDFVRCTFFDDNCVRRVDPIWKTR